MIRAVATIALVVGGLAVLTPGTAEAATCGQSWSDKDKAGYGYGIASSGHPVRRSDPHRNLRRLPGYLGASVRC